MVPIIYLFNNNGNRFKIRFGVESGTQGAPSKIEFVICYGAIKYVTLYGEREVRNVGEVWQGKNGAIYFYLLKAHEVRGILG